MVKGEGKGIVQSPSTKFDSDYLYAPENFMLDLRSLNIGSDIVFELQSSGNYHNEWDVDNRIHLNSNIKW